MGPNYYLTPPGGFTQFHQDGYGSVDSGHLCVEGYNEVVLLRRMDESHKINALRYLKCDDRRKGKKIDYDALYGFPHDNVSNSITFLYTFNLFRILISKSFIGRETPLARS